MEWMMIFLPTLLVTKALPLENIILLSSMSMMYLISMLFSQSNPVVLHFWGNSMMFDLTSTMMITLTMIINICCFLSMFSSGPISMNFYSKCFLVGAVLSMNLFAISNMIYFFILFEMGLIPIIMIILGWGYQPERLVASKYMMFYTITGSMPLLGLIIILSSFFTAHFYDTCASGAGLSSLYIIEIISVLLVIGFLIKLPMFFLHLWLPKAHVEAPVEGSMFLAAILLKLGASGLIRFSNLVSGAMIFKVTLSITMVSMVLVSGMCCQMVDLKILIAYSSIGHMGMGMSSFLVFSTLGFKSFLVVLTAHGISSSYMFFMAFSIYSNTNTRSLLLNKNCVQWAKLYTLFWFFSCISMLGTPPMVNFLGEAVSFMSLNNYLLWAPPILIMSAMLAGVYSIISFSVVFSKNSLSMFMSLQPVKISSSLNYMLHLFWLMSLWGLTSVFLMYLYVDWIICM